MRFPLVVFAYVAWLMAMLVVYYLTHGQNETALQITLIGGVLPGLLQILVLGIDWRGLVAPMRIWLALVLVIVVSYVANALDPHLAPQPEDNLAIPATWIPIVYTLNVVFIAAISTLIAGCPDRRLLRSIAGMFCAPAAAFLVYVDLTGTMLWGRLVANDLQPNVWGLMSLNVCIAAFARKPGPIAAAAFAAGAVTMLQASSREHMLALVIALLVAAVLYLRTINPPRLIMTLAGAAIALVATAFVLDPYLLDAVHYVGSDVLLVNSTSRGVNSGFSGRADIWAATVNLWLKHPLFGVGFRQHEQFLEGGMPAHNAFLAMLADTGIFGLIVYVTLLARSLAASWNIADVTTRRFVVLVLVSYVVIGFFDRRAINGGNPYSLFFLMCCSYALTEQSLRKAARAAGRRAAWDGATAPAFGSPGGGA
jgi:O-antigen ligase